MCKGYEAKLWPIITGGPLLRAQLQSGHLSILNQLKPGIKLSFTNRQKDRVECRALNELSKSTTHEHFFIESLKYNNALDSDLTKFGSKSPEDQFYQLNTPHR